MTFYVPVTVPCASCELSQLILTAILWRVCQNYPPFTDQEPEAQMMNSALVIQLKVGAWSNRFISIIGRPSTPPVSALHRLIHPPCIFQSRNETLACSGSLRNLYKLYYYWTPRENPQHNALGDGNVAKIIALFSLIVGVLNHLSTIFLKP